MRVRDTVAALQLDHMGAVLFGSAMRARLIAWLAVQPAWRMLSTTEITRGADSTTGQLRRLVDLGLVEDLGQVDGQRCHYYARTDHDLWEPLTSIVADIGNPYSGGDR